MDILEQIVVTSMVRETGKGNAIDSPSSTPSLSSAVRSSRAIFTSGRATIFLRSTGVPFVSICVVTCSYVMPFAVRYFSAPTQRAHA